MTVMDATHYFQEVEKYIDSMKHQLEDEKKEISECQKKFSNLVNTFSQKAPSNSIIDSLFKDDEPEGFVFSKYEDKQKQLAEQRKAEYNTYLEKKEAERLSKQRPNIERKNVSAKSILDSVDYERILARRKEEEAKFRDMNIADILHHSKPVLTEDVAKPLEEKNFVALENENTHQLLEQRIAKQLEEQRRQMLLEYENELRRDVIIKEETQNLKSFNSTQSSPQRTFKRTEDLLKLGRTGGGGDPVRDSYGNLLTMRGQRKESNSDYSSIMSFPSMQQQPIKDRMAIYREELQKQIEEKKCLEALERAKAQKQEEKIAQRIEEQRLKMQEEYESELKKNNKIKEEFQRQQERIRKLEEFQRKDAEARRKKFVEMKAPSPEKIQPPIIEERSNSPPIPAVRTKVLLEKAVEVASEVKPDNMFSSLAEIRRKIMEEQQKPKKNLKKSYEVMNRRTVQELSDDDDDDIFKSSTNSYNQYST